MNIFLLEVYLLKISMSMKMISKSTYLLNTLKILRMIFSHNKYVLEATGNKNINILIQYFMMKPNSVVID